MQDNQDNDKRRNKIVLSFGIAIIIIGAIITVQNILAADSTNIFISTNDHAESYMLRNNGTIKLEPNGNQTCNTTENNGSIYYTGTTFYKCDGTGWTNIGDADTTDMLNRMLIMNNTINTMDTITDVDNKDATINATISSIGNLTGLDLDNLVGWDNTTSNITTSNSIIIGNKTFIGNSINQFPVTSLNGPRALNVIDTGAVVRVLRYSSDATASPGFEFLMANSSGVAKWWDVITEGNAMTFRRRDVGPSAYIYYPLVLSNSTGDYRVGINNANHTTLGYTLDVNGTGRFRGALNVDGSLLASGYLNSAGFVNVMSTARLIFQNSTPTTISQMYLSGNNLKITTIENGTIDLLTANGSVRINQANATADELDVNGSASFRGTARFYEHLNIYYGINIFNTKNIGFYNGSAAKVPIIMYDNTNLIISPRNGGTYANLNIPNTIVNMTNTSLSIKGILPGTSYPLEVVNNQSGSNVSIWASGYISAAGYTTRTTVYDGKEPALSLIKNSSTYMKSDGSVDHDAFSYSEVKYPVQVAAVGEPTICNESCNNETGECVKSDCKANKDYKAPSTKIEEGVNLDKEIALLKQAIYELKTIVCKDHPDNTNCK